MDTATTDTDQARLSLGFLGVADTAALRGRGIVIPDPSSTLVSPDAVLGPGVVLWPGIVVQCGEGGAVSVGAGTVLSPGTRIVASGGRVTIGSEAEIGEEGGFTIKAEAGAVIEIGDGARLLGGGSLTLSNRIGRGAQILGPIRCQNCRLGDGGTHRDPDPDRRGGVLKGSGVARTIHVPQGHVIQTFGLFAEATMRPQSFFHPKTGG
jgi:hypothetical protein